MLRWRIWVAAVWYRRVRTRGGVLEHWHACRGWVQLLGGLVATSFFSFDLFYMPFDTRSSHRLARILCKVCFKGYVSLLYPHQPARTSVPFPCLRCIPLYTMIGIDTVYCILYMFGVLVTTMQLSCCFVCVWGVVLQLAVCLQSPVSVLRFCIPYLSTCYFIFIVYVCILWIMWSCESTRCVLVRCMCHFIWVGLQVSV
jgi:hypothetical protein